MKFQAATAEKSPPVKGSDELELLQRVIKKYRAFLAAVGGVGAPMAGVQLLPPPAGHEHLKYAATFLCIVAFCIPAAYRDLIARSLNEGTIRRRPAPLLCGLVAAAAGFLTAVYIWRQPTPDLMQFTLYVFLWPLYVIPLTVLLMVLYYKQDRRFRFHAALDQLSSHSDEIVDLLVQFPNYDARANQNLALKDFGAGTIKHVRSLLEGLMQGRVINSAVQMPEAFAKLVGSYDQFDATSVRELAFWFGAGRDSFARDYFDVCVDLVRQGKRATRMFVVSGEELEQGPDILAEVLSQHFRAGIGFAVVPYEELPPRVRQLGDEKIDFGIWEKGQAYSVFRQKNDPYRSIRIVFRLDQANCDVQNKVELYQEMLRHVWLVDRKYCEIQKDSLVKLKDDLEKINAHVVRGIGRDIRLDGDFLLEVATEVEIRRKVAEFIKLRTLSQHEDAEIQQAEGLKGTTEPGSGAIRGMSRGGAYC